MKIFIILTFLQVPNLFFWRLIAGFLERNSSPSIQYQVTALFCNDVGVWVSA